MPVRRSKAVRGRQITPTHPQPLECRARGISAMYLPAHCDAPARLDARGPMVTVWGGAVPVVKVSTTFDTGPVACDRIVLIADGERMTRPVGEREAYDPYLFRIAQSIRAGFLRNLPPPAAYLESLSEPLNHHLQRYYAPRRRRRERLGLSPARLAKALALIEARLFEGITIDELADAVHLSACHFCQMFKRSTGLPPHSYVARVRIEAAAHLLSTTSLTIAEVARRTGFRTQAHFCTTFRRVKGTPPSQHRLASVRDIPTL